jgi:hypothetical protein
MRRIKRKIIALVLLAAAAAAGFAVQGWLGIFLWPLTLCALALLLEIALAAIDIYLTVNRNLAEVSRIKARVRGLSNEQLRELCESPSHRDSGFARVELMRRGIAARPPKEQLFSMLTSGNSVMCGQAMGYLQMFYPELRALLPKGSSNLDPPEVWRARVAAVQSAG